MSYQKKSWVAGDVIEAAALNHMEDGIGAAAAWTEAVEDMLARSGGSGDFAYYGTSPCVLTAGGDLRLTSGVACGYEVYSPTAADLRHGGLTCTGCAVSTDDGWYDLTVDPDVQLWYLAHVDVTLAGLTAGAEYALVIDCLGREIDEDNGLQYGYFIVCGEDGTQLATIDPQPAARTSLAESTLAFTAPGETVVVKIYPANGGGTTAGARANFNDLWINRAGAGTAHTEIFRAEGEFTGAALVKDAPAGARVEASPACGVYTRSRESTVLRLKGRHAGKTIVCFGDSITGGPDAPDDYPSVIAEELGAMALNAGFGGCRMSQTHPEAAYDAFCMCRLADAVASGDWSLQAQCAESLGAAARVQALAALDWSQVDFVTIAFGTNDIQAGVPLDDALSPLARTTYLGALRAAVETLLAAQPHLKLLLLTPIYRYWNAEELDSNEKTFGGRAFTDWGDGLLATAGEYGLPALDLYRTAGLNRLTRETFYPAADGTHPNAAGQRRLGEKIAARLLADY